MHYESNMTSKGQVTVPKDIREALGLKPGQRVRFEMDGDGNARIAKVDDTAQAARRASEFRQRLADVRKQYQPLREFADMDGMAYQHWIRESPEV